MLSVQAGLLISDKTKALRSHAPRSSHVTALQCCTGSMLLTARAIESICPRLHAIVAYDTGNLTCAALPTRCPARMAIDVLPHVSDWKHQLLIRPPVLRVFCARVTPECEIAKDALGSKGPRMHASQHQAVCSRSRRCSYIWRNKVAGRLALSDTHKE